MNESKKRLLIVLSITLVVLVSLAFVSDLFIENGPIEKLLLTITRSKEGRTTPDPSDAISEIRVTAVDRNVSFLPKVLFDKEARNMNFKQLYYGYCIDGVWRDIPAENYSLRSLFHTDDGYKALKNNHCVQIGPYILLAFPISKVYGKDTFGVIQDTLSSTIHKIEDHATASVHHYSFNGANCGHLIDSHVNGYCVELMDNFDLWYFVVLNQEQLTLDYQVTIQKHCEVSAEDEPIGSTYTVCTQEGVEVKYAIVSERTYTYEDIINALERE